MCCHALARVVGIMEVDGDIQHVVDQWRSLALVCAMLTSIAAAGLFTSAEYLHNINEVSKNNNGTMHSQHIIAKLTVMIFCVDTFCFLNTTVMSTFFIAFASRHPHHSLKLETAVHVSRYGIPLAAIVFSYWFLFDGPGVVVVFRTGPGTGGNGQLSWFLCHFNSLAHVFCNGKSLSFIYFNRGYGCRG